MESRVTEDQQTELAITGSRRMRQLHWVLAFSPCLLAIIVSTWDISISQQIQTMRIPGDLKKAIHLCETIAHGFGATIILATLFWIDVAHRRRLVQAALLTLCSGVLSNAAKYLVPRVRPYFISNAESPIESSWQTWGTPLSGSWFEEAYRSFPSGHSATAVALALGLAYVYPRGRWIFCMLAIGACLQRILAGAHYPSDVLVGAAIGLALAPWFLNETMHQRIRRWSGSHLHE